MIVYTDATADDGQVRTTDLETGETVIIDLTPAEDE